MTEAKFPWEGREPDHVATGFVLGSSNYRIHLAYAVAGQAVLLLASTQVGTSELVPWRRFWVPKETAVEAATQLAAEAEEFLLEDLGAQARPNEDLDLEDFIHHLKLRLENALH